MIKSWWAEKSTSEKQIVAALAVLSLGVFCWLGLAPTVRRRAPRQQALAYRLRQSGTLD